MALFAHVVRLRSFTRAAEHVGIAKSAVSKRITALEDALGVKLLRRTTRTLSLTDEGMRYFAHCERLVSAARDAQESVADLADAPRGSLRIGAPVTLSQMRLAALVAEFLQAEPGIDVELVAEDRLVDLVEGGFDAVVRVTRLTDSALVARRIATDRLVFCASPAYLAAAGVPLVPTDLVHHACLHYAQVPLAHEWRFRKGKDRYVVPVRPRFSSNDGAVLREVSKAGLGIAVLPHFMVAEDVAAGRLALVLEGTRRAEIGIHIVYPHREHVPKRLRLFVDFVAKRFAQTKSPVPTKSMDRQRPERKR